MNLADGYVEITLAALRGARPDPELKVDEWSDDHMMLPKNTAISGQYRVERTPYARRPMQVLSPGFPCKRVVACVASQMFKTQSAINWLSASMHQAPANMLALEPNDTLAKRLMARIKKSASEVKVLQDVVAQPRSRDSRNTAQLLEFKGGELHVLTAGSAANIAEIAVRYLYVDEVDRMEESVDGEGDPCEIAEARTTTYDANCKIYYTSSPTIKGYSKIETLWAMGTQETYHVPCPHCGHLHELVLANFHFKRDDKTGYMERAWFVCPDCGSEIEERHKGAMLKDVAMGGQARWVAASPGDGETVSFRISAFYAKPGDISWLTLARQYSRALEREMRGDTKTMQVFYNTRLALSYDDTVNATSVQQLMDKALNETYRLRVMPDAALVATMSVDTQPDRLETSIEAWGPGLEHWVMDYQVLVGPPTDPPSRAGSVWQRLDILRRTPLMHASGVPVYISAYGVDSGGHNTQDVYNYGAARESINCTILKGASRPGKPIISSVPSKVDINWNGEKTEHGARLWMIGTDTAKEWLYNRMNLVDGEGAMHMHPDLGPHWFAGMVSERPRRRVQKNGKVVVEWIPDPNVRNEPWDCSVYNLAMAYKLGLHKWSAQDWARLRAKLIPANLTRDLFTQDQAPTPAPVPVKEVEAVEAAPASHVADQVEELATEAVQPVPVDATDPADDESIVEPIAPPTTLPAPAARPLPLYPLQPMQGRRRRMRSRGI